MKNNNSINSYSVFGYGRFSGKTLVYLAETEEYFVNGDIQTVTEYHFSTIRGVDAGFCQVKEAGQYRQIRGDVQAKELIKRFQLIA